MELEIKPYQSFGPLHYGIPRSEGRSFIEEEPKTELMSNGSVPNDTYEKLRLYVIYDKYNKLAGAEIQRPCKPIFQGKNLLKMPWNESLAWFKKMDPEVQETHKEFISYKFGIAVYAPSKNENPESLPKTITVFKKDYFNQKVGIPQAEHLESFFIQNAYVEAIPEKNEKFETVSQAMQGVFSRNKENGIILWNEIPVKFNYTFDLPVLLPQFVSMLQDILTKEEGEQLVELKCGSFETVWKVKWNKKYVLLNSDWKLVSGSYSGALNEVNQLTLLRSEFLAEWKMLLQQCHSAFETSGATISNAEEAEIIDAVKQLEKRIKNFGKFYRDASPSVVTKNAEGRIEVDLNHLSKGFKWLLGTGIIVSVFFLSWYLMRHMGNPFWMLEALIPVLMYTFGIGIPLVALVMLYLRYRERH